MLPSNAIADRMNLVLNDMAAEGMGIKVDWSWEDDLPTSLIRQAGRHQKRSAAWSTVELRDGMYGGWVLAERDPDESLDALRADHHELARTLKDWHRDDQRRNREESAARRIAAKSSSALDASPDLRAALRRWRDRLGRVAGRGLRGPGS